MPATDDHQLAAELAAMAGRGLITLRAQMEADGAPRWALKDAGDQQAHHALMAALADRRPTDAVLSEEGRDNAARLSAARTWIVDPLDGTREFSEPPRTDWAVHVALVEDGSPTAGAVALPSLGVTYSTDASGGAVAIGHSGAAPGSSGAELTDVSGAVASGQDGLRPTPVTIPDHDGPIRLVVSRTRPLTEAVILADRLGGELVPMGSAGAKTMAILRGEADVYAHAGGQYEWDSCAPAAVAAAAGLWCSRLDGSPLRYNRPDPWLPDLLICRQELVAPVRDLLARMGW